MKNLTLSIGAALLFALQANAQQSTAINVSPNVSESSTVTITSTTNRAQEIDDDGPMRSKTFSKSFSLSQSDKVNLSNQYGSITIKTWDKNEIKVDADIKAYAKTAEEAQKLLDNVSISANKDGDAVSYRTTIADTRGNWGSSIRNGKVLWRREMKIHFTVYMPSANALTASQTYGGITMADFAGPTSLKVQYGNLVAGNLSNSNNYISVQYGKANLENVNAAKIKHQYGGGITIATIGTLELNAQYTSARIGTIKNSSTIKHQYGDGVTITNAGTLNVDAQYTSVKIAKLKGDLTTKIQYGKLNIEEVETGSKMLNVNADYTSVNLGFSPSFQASFDVAVRYGDFRYGSNVKAKRLGEGRDYSSSKNYTGEIGKGSGTAKVSIKANYDSVTFR